MRKQRLFSSRKFCRRPGEEGGPFLRAGLFVPGLIVSVLFVAGLIVPGRLVAGLAVPGLFSAGLVVPGFLIALLFIILFCLENSPAGNLSSLLQLHSLSQDQAFPLLDKGLVHLVLDKAQDMFPLPSKQQDLRRYL